MSSENLPIFKLALNLSIYLDSIVKNQERYYRHSIGEDMRKLSKELLFLINQANRTSKKDRVVLLKKLTLSCEDLKVVSVLAKELKALKSFKQFEYSSKLLVETSRQAKAWLNSSAGILR